MGPSGCARPLTSAAFNPSCFQTGSHITCTLAFSDPDLINDPDGIICGDTMLLATLHRSVVGKRLYDADGNLLQRHFREYVNGTITNPDTGRVVMFTQHDTVIHNLATPGDLGSGTEKISATTRPTTGPCSPYGFGLSYETRPRRS